MILIWVSKLRFCNSKQKKKLLLKAVWAENVFDEIIKTKDKPLIDYLLNYKFSQSLIKALKQQNVTYNDIDESRTEFMKKFDPYKGVKLPQSFLLMQRRLVQAVNKQGNLTFYPNTFTTPDIFKIEEEIMNGGIQWNSLTLGRPGISKTMSYVLSWVLSSESACYRYLYPKDTTRLINLNVLRNKMSKIIYLSFRESQANFLYFTQIILDQCPQVNKQVQAQCREIIKKNMSDVDFSSVLEEIKYLYKIKGVQCLVILDQINTLANRFKRAHQLLKKDEKAKKQFQQFLLQSSILFRVYCSISTKFPKVLNSSSNIQEQLLNHKSPENLYSLNINHHTRASMHYLNVYQKVFQATKAKELYRFIWYQAAKRIPSNHQKIYQIKESIIKQCDQLAQAEGFKSYVTPLSIFDAFGAQKIAFADFYEEGKYKYKQFAARIYSSIKVQGEKMQILKLNKYLDNQSISGIRNLLDCWYHLYSDQNKTEVPTQNLRTDVNKSVIFNKDFFQLNHKKLELIVSRKEFLELFQIIINKLISNPQYMFLVLEIAERENIYGIFIQMAVLSMMKSYNQFIFSSPPHYYHSSATKNFIHFLGIGNIYKSLEKIIKEIKTSENLFCFPILPSTYDQQIEEKNQVISPNNPSFDFLHVKQNIGQIQITTFDLTTVNQKSSIENKLEKALTLLQNKLNFKILVKDQFVEQNDFIQFIYESIRKQRKSEQKLKVEEEKSNNPQTIKNIKEKIKKIKESRLNKLEKFCKQHLYNDKQRKDKLNNLTNNPDQLLEEIFKIFEQKCWGTKTKDIIKIWNHVVVCRSEFQDQKIKIPQNKIINGVNISFKLSPIHLIQIRTKKADSLKQFRNLLERLLEKIQQKTNAILQQRNADKQKAKAEQKIRAEQRAKADEQKARGAKQIEKLKVQNSRLKNKQISKNKKGKSRKK